MTLSNYIAGITITLGAGYILMTKPSDSIPSRKVELQFQETTEYFRFKAILIDTVREEKIRFLCDHCAMAIRFYVEPTYLGSKYVDVVIFHPIMDKMKLDNPGKAFSIKAYSRYKGPSTLIVPAVNRKKDVPILWCDSIAPAF